MFDLKGEMGSFKNQLS